MAPIAIPATGLRLPTFWDVVRAQEPHAFAAEYPDPFLIQLASLSPDEVAAAAKATEAAAPRGAPVPTVSGGSKLGGIALLPWADTRVASLTKRTDADPGRVAIGRGAGSDVIVGSPLVSKRHALIERQGEEWVLTDVGSRNGSTLAGVRVAPNRPTPIEFGTEVGFGDTRWLFVLPLFFHHAVKALLPRDASA